MTIREDNLRSEAEALRDLAGEIRSADPARGVNAGAALARIAEAIAVVLEEMV